MSSSSIPGFSSSSASVSSSSSKPTVWIYIPNAWKDDPELLKDSKALLSRVATFKSDRYVASPERISSDGLEKVSPRDPIFILGHGIPLELTQAIRSQPKIYRTLTMRDGISAEELARDFIGKLNPEHETIKMWVCWAGRGMEKAEGLAFKFWQAMTGSFPRLTVYGYIAALSVPKKDEPAVYALSDPGLGGDLAAGTRNMALLGPPKLYRQSLGPAGRATPALNRTPSMEAAQEAAAQAADDVARHAAQNQARIRNFFGSPTPAATANRKSLADLPPELAQIAGPPVSVQALAFGMRNAIQPGGYVVPQQLPPNPITDPLTDKGEARK
jgi:hypothetical protein